MPCEQHRFAAIAVPLSPAMAALTCRKCCDSTHIPKGHWSTFVVSRVQSYAVLVAVCQLPSE